MRGPRIFPPRAPGWAAARGLIGILCVAAAVAPTAQASVVVALTEAQRLQHSDVVAACSVVDSRAVSIDGAVVTEVQLQVHRPVRGVAEGDVIVMQLPGGTLRGIRHQVTGVPSLKAGALWVVFLEAHAHAYRPVGLGAGMYAVDTAPRRPWSVARDLRGLHFVASRSDNLPGPPQVRAAGEAAPEPLETFLHRLDALAAGAP